ncbi:hypothetical protein [Chifec microvirus UA13_14]|nr:hypothetical protein [Chifec microvirus UA13_14]
MESIWAVFFSSVVTMQFHPGASRGDSVKLSLSECADIADMMLAEFERRFPSCRG